MSGPRTLGDEERVRPGLEAQQRLLQEKLAAGDELLGWKIGLNLEPVQRALGLEAPVVGHLTRNGLVQDGGTHSLAGGVRVGVEPEVAIHVGADLRPGAGPEEALAAIAGLGPAIEIVDLDPSRDGLEEVLACNVFHRALVLGAPVPGVGPGDLATLEACVMRAGVEAERTRFADTGDDPAAVLVTVVCRLALVGERLRAGQTVIAGSLTPIVFVEPGDEVQVDLGPLGRPEVGFPA